MKIADLESRIEARANDAAQKRVQSFKTEVDAALTRLLGSSGSGNDQFGNYSKYDDDKRPCYDIGKWKRAVLQLAINNSPADGRPCTWPAVIWSAEREAIREELLSKMDLMQQLLASQNRPREGDVTMSAT